MRNWVPSCQGLVISACNSMNVGENNIQKRIVQCGLNYRYS